MGYLYICLGVIAGVTKGFCGKKTSGNLSEVKDAMLANMLRMVLCIAVGFFVVFMKNELPLLKINKEILLLALLSGISTSVFVVSWLVAVKKGAYMMLDVFLMIGTAIPLGMSFMLFDERIELNQWIGLFLLIVAVLIMCSYNNSIKTKMNLSQILLLILCGTSSGVADFSQKLFVKTESIYSVAVFNFYTYVFSSIFLFLCFLILFKKGDKTEKKKSFGKIKPVFLYIAIMSVCLFVQSYFKTLAAGFIPAAQLYPLMQGLGLMLSVVMCAVFFGEKLTVKCITGILIAFTGLIFINVF